MVLAEESREAPLHDSFDGIIGYNTYALNTRSTITTSARWPSSPRRVLGVRVGARGRGRLQPAHRHELRLPRSVQGPRLPDRAGRTRSSTTTTPKVTVVSTPSRWRLRRRSRRMSSSDLASTSSEATTRPARDGSTRGLRGGGRELARRATTTRPGRSSRSAWSLSASTGSSRRGLPREVLTRRRR